MVTIFAREITDDLASLVKKIDKKVGENKDQKMAAFVVILTDDPDTVEPRLEELADKAGIEHTPLTVFDGTAGPPRYKIAEGADVTVLMWRKTKVQANHAFEKGELNAKAVEKVVSDTSRILK